MKDEVEERVVDELLRKYLDEERRQPSPRQFELRARATLQRVVAKARRSDGLNRLDLNEAIDLLRRLLAATADHPGVLAKALGYR